MTAGDNRGRTLLQIARNTIVKALGRNDYVIDGVAIDAGWLQQQGACFITLTQDGQLRGCIGSLEAHRSLLTDVMANATSAAFNDTRFTPLTVAELDKTQVEVSLLSAMQAMDYADEQHALQQLRPGVDGVLLEYGQHRGTFLPQVWEQLPEAEQFMAHLKQKAGLPSDYWADGVQLYRYTVSKWKEQDFGLPPLAKTCNTAGD